MTVKVKQYVCPPVKNFTLGRGDFAEVSTCTRDFMVALKSDGFSFGDLVHIKEVATASGRVILTGKSVYRRIRFVLPAERCPALAPECVLLQLDRTI